jgi:hypothetical protein
MSWEPPTGDEVAHGPEAVALIALQALALAAMNALAPPYPHRPTSIHSDRQRFTDLLLSQLEALDVAIGYYRQTVRDEAIRRDDDLF